jgi:hypothetical protein
VFVAGLAAAQVVPYERILNSARNRLLDQGGNYSGQRYSTLDQINTSNIKRLKVAWVHQSGTTESHQTSPIVVDHTLFITAPPNVVEALDATTGRRLWSYHKDLPNDLHSHLKLAEVYTQLQQFARAVDEYGFVAEEYAQDGFYDKGIALLSKAMKLAITSRVTRPPSRRWPARIRSSSAWPAVSSGSLFIDAYDADTGRRLAILHGRGRW